ncbi:unnamed protein product [Musa acuminata subsp. burmannicoides]|uniref:(wild Malaysian banana) hypothetical protein n=1 Tax=Musa acuminata subsp. malaccensis TaxID=214687 RepID=A0A8D7FQE3_MUSAM|nr:unnamed protein product [Musa acuminata subsp. malaccensis]
MASSNAAAASDPLSSTPSPRAARPGRHPRSHLVPGDPEAPSSPSSTPSPPTAAAIPFPDALDRSPQRPPVEDVAPSSSDAARGKKPAWKRPPNGSIDAGAVVMGGAASWPALSESAKTTSKSPSSDALKALSDGPLSAPPESVVSNSAPKPNSNPSSTPNHVAPARHKSMKRGSSSGNNSSVAQSDGGISLPSTPPTSGPVPQASSDRQAPPEPSPGSQITRGGGSGSQAHDTDSHPRGHGGNRRWNNGGGGGGGGGSHHNNYGNRYDGYRRNAGGRDAHIPHRGARPYLRLPVPPVAPPFLTSPSQVRPYPMVFPDMHSPVFYVATQPPPGGVPFVPHPALPPAVFIPTIDPQRASLLKQIDYYFSSDNLCKDVFLRQNMDEQGWVPISLIAGFNRVRQLTNSIDFILDTVQLSTEVEVQGEKIRKRNDWMNWVLPPNNNQFANISSQSPATPNSDNL